jgi:hypothetical protein
LFPNVVQEASAAKMKLIQPNMEFKEAGHELGSSRRKMETVQRAGEGKMGKAYR